MRWEIYIQFSSGVVYKRYYDNKETATNQYVLMHKSMREKSVLYSSDVIIDFSKVELIEMNELEEITE